MRSFGWAVLLTSVLAQASTPAQASPRAQPRSAPQPVINLEVEHADIHAVLQLLAERGRVNLVVGDEVSGTVTLRLRHVRWEDALEAVLLSRGLGSERRGNIVWVASLKTLAEQAEMRARLSESRQATAPLVTRIVHVSYARAQDLVEQVKATLSPRGTVTVDARTNALILRDVE